MGKTGENKIEIHDIQSFGNCSDWGQTYGWTCPLCGDEFRWCEYGDKIFTCTCGYTWTLVLKAIGELK